MVRYAGKGFRLPVILGIVAALLVAAPLGADMFGQAVEGNGKGNPNLSGLVMASVVPMVQDPARSPDGTDTLATSYLKPEGKAPALTLASPEIDEGVWFDEISAYNNWSGMYSSSSACDGDPATCWVEGRSGPGVGETLMVRVDMDNPLFILPGFQKNKDLFAKNARPRDIRISILKATRIVAAQTMTGFMDLRVVSQTDQRLEDRMGWQALVCKVFGPAEVDALCKDEEESRQLFVAVTILSVYPGTKYQDTCISELGIKP